MRKTRFTNLYRHIWISSIKGGIKGGSIEANESKEVEQAAREAEEQLKKDEEEKERKAQEEHKKELEKQQKKMAEEKRQEL